MKTVFERLEEFAELNEAKIELAGNLPADLEARWRELKAYYDRLMTKPPTERGPMARRLVIDEIRRRLRRRDRLRVRAVTDFFFHYQNTYLSARLVNLSKGGLFFSSHILLAKGSPVALYLPNLGPGYEALFETRGEVVWSSKGDGHSGLPRGMGVRFLDVEPEAAAQLDAFVVEALERRLPVGSLQAFAAPIAGRDCFYLHSK